MPLSQGRSNSRTLMLFLLVAALGAPVASYAKDWDTARQTLIDPLNSALHSHWPKQLQSRELDTLVRLYATQTGTGLRWDDVQPVSSSAEETTLRWTGSGGEEPIRERYEKLLALFADISRTELRIGRVDWRNPDPLGYRTTVHLIVRGTGPEGDRRQLEQYATLRVRYFDPFWEITQEEVTARTLVSLGQPRFEWATAAVGIDSIHQNQASPPFRLFGDTEENPVRQASGVAVGDANRDGCEDLILAGSPDLVFYRSRCDGTFEDATREVGLPRPYPAAAGGVVFLDYDNDGWLDLFVAAVSGGDRLFHNDGTGRFVDVSRDVGVPAGR